MPTSNPWIVCEKSGRWAAALRVTSRREKAITLVPRILEVRNLAELDAAMHNQKEPLGFVEVRPDNLGTVLELLTNGPHQNVQYVVLLDDALAGMRPALKLAEFTAAGHTKRLARTNELELIAERAWAALPWQDG